MSRAVMRWRIPPESERLKFARFNRTGTVHILCWSPGPYDDGFEPQDVPFTAENLMNALRMPAVMLCGARFLVSGFDTFPGTWEAGDGFEDDDLCHSCVRALGGQSWRAFHEDNRGPE